jgi:KDO2-lipid IV(A) lauroyltransferase
MDSTLFRLLLQPRHWIAAFSLSLLWLVNLLPFPIKIRLGMGLGNLLYYVLRNRRHVADVNLKLCFPDMSETRRDELVRGAFKNFGAGLVETAMGWWTEDKKIHQRVSYEGREHLDAAIAQGKGVILVGAHFSCLDLAGKLVNRHYDIHAVYRRQKNQLVDYALRRGRSTAVLSMIDNRNTRQIVRTIRAGGIVWFAADHDMGPKVSVFAPFFSHDAATVTATAKFAKMTGAPVVFCANHRTPDNNRYVVRMKPIVADFKNSDDVTIATLVNKTIADHILIDPAQYYWFHRKFKTQPGLPFAALYRVK